MRCGIHLFGGLRVTLGDQIITRFATRKNASLLAYLAFRPGRTCSREALIELLWPESEPELGRRSLRTALASLRRQLEPPGVPDGSVLEADRTGVRLNPANVETDVEVFERSLRAASESAVPAERIRMLTSAVDGCPGRLLPELYDDWIYPEQERLAEAFQNAVRQLVRLLEQENRPEEALEAARKGAAADPLSEETRGKVISLLAAAGRAEAALREYADLEAVLQRELGAAPAASLRTLAADLRRSHPQAAPLAVPVAPTPQVVATRQPPPAASKLVSPTLPLTATRLFGRNDEIETLLRLLAPGPDAARLVTLTGPGGVGKTRLSVEAGRRLAADYDGRVTFIPLADLRESGLIIDAIGTALRLPPPGRGERTEQVIAELAGGPALLVLDNFEQIVTGGAEVVWTLLSRAPELACLVSSRAALALPLERRIALRPLPLPDPTSEPEIVLRSPSAAFFLDRSQAVRPDFAVTRSNATTVVELLRLLEGLPLALELAAARSGVLTPAQMVDLIAKHSEEFASRERNRPDRHRSLRACLEWSYDLLPERLGRFFAALSVFRGGCLPEAAAEVCGDGVLAEALDSLAQLRGWSLVQPEESEGRMRFRMLETIREFAAGRVPGAERGPLRRRHLAYFLRMAEDAAPELAGARQAARLAELEADHDNLRAALELCGAERALGEAGLRLAGSLARFWEVRGHLQEGRIRLGTALAHPGAQAPTAPRAAALHAAGSLAVLQGEYAPVPTFFEECIAIRRDVGDPLGVATVLNTLGNMAWDRSEFAVARGHYEESLALRREAGDGAGIAGSLGNLASVLQKLGDREGSLALREESLARFREAGDQRAVAVALGHLGIAAYEREDHATARDHYAESLEIRRELGDQLGIATSLSNLGLVADALQDRAQARALHSESLAMRRELGDRRGMAYSLANLGNLAAAERDWTTARALQAESLTLRLGLGDIRGVGNVLADCARRAAAEKEHALAVRLAGAAERCLQEASAALPEADRNTLECALAESEAVLGGDRVTALRRAGFELSPEAAVALAAVGAPGQRR